MPSSSPRTWRRLALVVALVLVLGLVHALAERGTTTKLPHWLTAPRVLSAAPLGASFGPARTVPRGLLGFNGEAVTGAGEVWTNPGFARAVAALHPQAIRVFGGTPANFWNWRTGTFVLAQDVPRSLAALRATVHVTLADWARIVRQADALPVFDLNMLTSDLPAQLAMLHAARALGMPVLDVELGNELYLPTYAKRFRDGAAYGREASRWIAALKRAFPGVSVAADAYPGPDNNAGTVDRREQRWNAGLLRTLRGESALSMHTYFASGLGPRASLASPRSAAAMLTGPTRRFVAFARLLSTLPNRVKIWVTEWNLFDTVARVHETWAQGLAVAAYGFDLLTTPRVAQADYHALVSNGPFDALFGSRDDFGPADPHGQFRPVLADPPATPVYGLAAGGVAMQALLGALAGAHELRALGFGSAPVGGAMFTGGSAAGAVIVNLTADLAPISVPERLRGLAYTERWAPPITVVAGTASLQSRAGTTAATLDLEPFSLLWIKPARSAP